MLKEEAMNKRKNKTSPLKIAVLGHKTIPSRQGGIEIVVEELTVRMAKLGHKITVLTVYLLFVIEVSFANIEPQLESGKNSLGTIMGLYKKFQGVSGSIKISVGKKRKGTLSIDEISEFVTDAMEEKSVKALKLHVKDDDSKPVEIIDLFDAIANSVITFKMENRTVLEYNYAAQLMIKSYKDKKIYLLKSIRV